MCWCVNMAHLCSGQPWVSIGSYTFAFFVYLLCLFIYVGLGSHATKHMWRQEVNLQKLVLSFYRSFGTQGLNSGPQGWQQVPLSAELSCMPAQAYL